MKNYFEKLIQKAGTHVSLTEAEREKMRFLLREYAGMKPVRESAEPRARARAVFIDTWLIYLRRPASIALTAVLVLTLSSSGIAYAAEGALPGDTLYPIKVAVVEPVRLALAASPEASAALQMKFAERRVDEAATLASKGKLGGETEAALVANFTKNAAGAAITVAHERAQNPTAADVLTTNFAARLAAYEDVLAAVDKHSGDSDTTAHFQTVIRTQVISIANVQADDDIRAASSSRASVKERKVGNRKDIRHLQDATDAALRISADIIGTASSTLDSSSSASARDELTHASALAKKGRALLEQDDEEGASRAFQDSLSATARLDVLTRASAKLDIQAFATASTSTTSEIKTDESSNDQEDLDLPLGL
ncbi:MAG: DUF5667 domain-containing protein [Candidatus Paceibacterota bacterium]